MIRPANTNEAERLTQIALAAKRHWGYPEHWIKRWEADLTITPEYIDQNEVCVLDDEGEIKGFYALCVDGSNAELDHMWVEPTYIGAGIGKELFLDAMDRATALKVDAIEISSDPNAAGFYKRMGATEIGTTDSEIDGAPRKLPRLKINPQ